MTRSGRVVGIDIAKRKADACIRALGLHTAQPATPAGEREMIAWLQQHQVALAVMEASGGYERGWAEALRAAGIAVRVVDPKRVRYFAKSAGRLAKNDAIDAEMIAWFGETFGLAGAESYDKDRDSLDRLVTARALLVKVQAAVRQLAEHQQPRVVLAAQRAILKVLDSHIGKLEAAADANIAASPVLAARAKIIASVPGLGRHFVAGALAWLPELGQIGNKPLAALVGVAPYDDDSGQHAGERHIRGGRQELRNLLFMATLGAATQHNPILRAYYRKLRAKGKKAKVALVACMRKIILILNTMLARNQTWNPPGLSAEDAGAVAAPA
jgi:transposase